MALYSTSVPVPGFSGLNQSGDGYNLNMQYATEMENVSVEGNTFRQMREGLKLPQELTDPIGTLAHLYRRFGAGIAGTSILVSISNGRVFTKILDGPDEWTQRYPALIPPETEGEEPTEDGDPLTISDCDWITYEVNTRDGQDLDEPVDVLLFSNAKDGMFCLYGDTLDVVAVTTPKKFGVLARYNERIWGAGIEGDPDMLVYSAPFDPFDWEADPEIPEDGAGDIQQPTWDGDSFVALRQYGNSLLCVKRNSVWRLYGTNPGEFQMQREYGGGTIVENSVVVHNAYAYMLGENGLMRYDGSGVYPFLQEMVENLMHDKVNHDWMDQACAAMRNQTYCLALPINGSEFCNAVLEYDTANRAFSLRTGISVSSFLQVNERLFYTSATQPGRVFELRDDIGRPLFCEWISGYQDLGMKNAIKSAFILYMMVDSQAPVEFRIGIRTEKKLKAKIVKTKPGKMSRIHLNLQGRIFRLEIRSYSAVPFTIAGGLRIDLELDPD